MKQNKELSEFLKQHIPLSSRVLSDIIGVPQCIGSRLLNGYTSHKTFRSFYKNFPNKATTDRALYLYLQNILKDIKGRKRPGIVLEMI